MRLCRNVLVAALAAGVSFFLLLTVAARADTYTYDQHGRLVSIVFASGSSVTFTYDAAGNRTVQVRSP